MICLPIKKQWFDMILSGKKKEEYRDIKEYWFTRFQNEGFLTFIGSPSFESKPVLFRNGYRADSPAFVAECTLIRGRGKVEWGAEPEKEYYILVINKIRR